MPPAGDVGTVSRKSYGRLVILCSIPRIRTDGGRAATCMCRAVGIRLFLDLVSSPGTHRGAHHCAGVGVHILLSCGNPSGLLRRCIVSHVYLVRTPDMVCSPKLRTCYCLCIVICLPLLCSSRPHRQRNYHLIYIIACVV